MTKLKLCGLYRECDIETVNRLMPEYIGFILVKKGHRYITNERAAELRKLVAPGIKVVGVFINSTVDNIVELYKNGVIDLAQLHGTEDDEYIKELRSKCDIEIIKAFRVSDEKDIEEAESSTADYVLLDSGTGSGKTFDWNIVSKIRRPYFLAGGLDTENVESAIETLRPFALDVSSGIETEKLKDPVKMELFVSRARSTDERMEKQ